MRLLLIRHGETVDNVAGLYAGVRDSALTVHGNLQAEKLGKYFAQRGFDFTYVFSSDLQRASKTANALLKAGLPHTESLEPEKPEVIQLEVLREQDFGFYEGKPFYARPRDSNRSGKDEHRVQHQKDPDFKDVESKESMSARMTIFVQDYLVPIAQAECPHEEHTVAIVSHGNILSHLWRCFLKCFPPRSVTLAPGLAINGMASLEHLGGWSNTGHLELQITRRPSERVNIPTTNSPSPHLAQHGDDLLSNHQLLWEYIMTINTVNGKEHLVGLKRVKGVGSSQYDEGQKNIDSFFKKRKAA